MTSKDLEVPTDDEKKKASPPPHFMKDKRVKVCGKWQKKGYKPTTAEQKLWVDKCKVQNRDPKTGMLKEKKDKK